MPPRRLRKLQAPAPLRISFQIYFKIANMPPVRLNRGHMALFIGESYSHSIVAGGLEEMS